MCSNCSAFKALNNNQSNYSISSSLLLLVSPVHVHICIVCVCVHLCVHPCLHPFLYPCVCWEQRLMQHPELSNSQLLADFLSPHSMESQFMDKMLPDVNLGMEHFLTHSYSTSLTSMEHFLTHSYIITRGGLKMPWRSTCSASQMPPYPLYSALLLAMHSYRIYRTKNAMVKYMRSSLLISYVAPCGSVLINWFYSFSGKIFRSVPGKIIKEVRGIFPVCF